MKRTQLHRHLFLAALLLAGTHAMAGVNLIVRQVGSDVVISGGGHLNFNGWTLSSEDVLNYSYLSDGGLNVGSEALVDFYDTPTNFSGPEFVVLGGASSGQADTASGAIFGIEATGGLVVPANSNVSGTDLQFSRMTFANRTIAEMAFTADRLHWSWNTFGSYTDFFNIVVARPSPKNITYQLIADPGLSNGYSFSGTITTDGTLGTFGAGGQPLPIIDWSITLTTPDGNDGVSVRLLTPLNSRLGTYAENLGIQFTATQIILPDGGTQSTGIGFSNYADGSEESFNASSAADGEGGGISIRDVSESPSSGNFFEPTPSDFVLANAITHPQLRIDGVVPAGASLSWDSVTDATYGIYSSPDLIHWVAVPGFNRLSATPPLNTSTSVPLPTPAKGFFFLGPATGD